MQLIMKGGLTVAKKGNKINTPEAKKISKQMKKKMNPKESMENYPEVTSDMAPKY